MGFVFMVLHWPTDERREQLAEGMLSMREAMLAIPGCVSVDPPLVTADGRCLVGISRWTTRQAFLDCGIELGAEDEVVEGETRPRQRFLLDEVVSSG